ncbi:TPA: caspase family protein [Photobacterium damselae]
MNRKMIALVVGNGNYPEDGAKLKNAVNDANDISRVLDSLGFTVIKKTDCSNVELDRAMSSFRDGLNGNDVGLFYFAGHGMQIDGENYITCIDTQFTDEPAAKWTSYPINRLIGTMDTCTNKTNIIILDACRNNPYERSWSRSVLASNLAPMFAPKGTLIAYSTSPGEKASDGLGDNGAYTDALLKHISKPDITIEDVFKKVRNSLSVLTEGKQTSWEHTSLTGDFYFNLSMGNRISKYANIAIADELFTIDQTNPCHVIISELKVRNWYTQNPAISRITIPLVNAADDNSLFVLGRNIYQAACGDTGNAVSFIGEFRSNLLRVPTDKQVCIIEGMLFEVFFNSKGDFRDSFKVAMFNKLFELQQYPDYKPAFDFIAELLLPFHNSFYVIPGKSISDASIELGATLVEESGNVIISSVHFDGESILRAEAGADRYIFDGQVMYDSLTYDELLNKLSVEMMIPRQYIAIQSTVPVDDSTRIEFPYRHTVKRS